MKITRCFNLLACSAMAISLCSISFSETLASQYSNSFSENTATGSRYVRVEYTGLSRSMGFFDEAQPKEDLQGSVNTRLNIRRAVPKPINYKPTGKTYRDGSIFGGTCCEATEKQDNSIFPGHGCSKDEMRGCEIEKKVKKQPCVPKKKKKKIITRETLPLRENFVNNYVTVGRRDVYRSIHNQCKRFAPIQLEWVDFRLNEEDINGTLAQKLGNYRFRIFGCRRFNKEAFLDQGRILQQDMRFMSIFENELKDCYNIIKIPNDLCTEETPSPLPEYLITAEITNYFMNICDKYDWNNSIKEDKRTGSSEITVKWTVTDINKSKVYWTRETNGYGELNRGEENGEILLVERAFADAVNNLRNHPGFQRQLSHRFSPAEKENQRIALIEYEREVNPLKCQYTKHDIEKNQTSKYVYTPSKPTETFEEKTVSTVVRKDYLKEQIPTPTEISKLSDGSIIEKQSNGTTYRTSKEGIKTEIKITEEAPVKQAVTETTTQTTMTETKKTETTQTTKTTLPIPEPAPLPSIPLTTSAIVTNITEEEPEKTIEASDLLEKDRPSEPLDVSMIPGTPEEKYGQKTEIKVDLNTTDLENPAGSIPLPAPEEPCNNMTLFGPDCDCNNKHYRGCEDNKLYKGCEDNKLYGGCDAQTLFSDCVNNPEGCKIANNIDLGIEEKGGVDATGSISKETWINIPVEDKSIVEAQNNLCVIERPVYDTPLTAEDIYKIRASIISIANNQGKKGAGLIISDQFVLTSADLITKDYNTYELQTINGVKFKGHAVRINPNKNVALLFMEKKTNYTPLSLNMELPKINGETYLTLGILDFDTGEGYLENSGKVSGYRYSENRGTEIIVDTYVQETTLGGALIDKQGTITGLAHTGIKPTNNTDLFLPIATAMKSVGLEICGKQIKDIPIKNTEISNAILYNTGSKEPLPMNKTERK